VLEEMGYKMIIVPAQMSIMEEVVAAVTAAPVVQGVVLGMALGG